MPAFDFPTSPANGQVSNGYTWDGQKWIAGVGTSGAPSNSNPIMDGVAAPGALTTYSRGDHVHPSDTSKASTASVAAKADTSYVDTRDALKVAKSGDTMTGSLVVTGAGSGVTVGQDVMAGAENATARYYFCSGAHALSFNGTNFVFAGAPLVVNTASIAVGYGGTTGTYYFGNTGTKFLNYDGSAFHLGGGELLVGAAISSTVADGIHVYNPGGYARVMSYGGGTWSFGADNAGGFVIAHESAGATRLGISNIGAFNLNGNALGGVSTLHTSSSINAGAGYTCKSGASGGYGGNLFNITHGVGQQLWIDSTNMGTIAYTSDYRIKKDVIDLPGMWDTVKALRPIKYTQAEFQPPSQKAFIAREVLKAREEAEKNPEAEPREVNTVPLFEADDIERWGFIAHELQDTLTPSAASGEKDAPDTIQSPNPWTVVAALTKALQEAMMRIETLETKVS